MLMFQRVLHHENVFTLNGPSAECELARGFIRRNAEVGLAPLTMGVDEAHARHRCSGDRGGQASKLVKDSFLQRVDNSERVQRRQALLLPHRGGGIGYGDGV